MKAVVRCNECASYYEIEYNDYTRCPDCKSENVKILYFKDDDEVSHD